MVAMLRVMQRLLTCKIIWLSSSVRMPEQNLQHCVADGISRLPAALRHSTIEHAVGTFEVMLVHAGTAKDDVRDIILLRRSAAAGGAVGAADADAAGRTAAGIRVTLLGRAAAGLAAGGVWRHSVGACQAAAAGGLRMWIDMNFKPPCSTSALCWSHRHSLAVHLSF